ncbi:hypothetical protein [Corynebacterium sp. LK31]|uniref:hypothetical protein n=1 Tax=Corynebacterium sp. LK31 TaxID=2044576 RepID=UPI0016520ADE|nr:hypothetical protein [Corynebacterium sp. LK31]
MVSSSRVVVFGFTMPWRPDWLAGWQSNRCATGWTIDARIGENAWLRSVWGAG